MINVHQGNILNPYINYPFLTTEKMSAFVKEAEKKGIKTKIYYTVRELSNYTKELWALRSLDGEIYQTGEGFRLADHFEEGGKFTPSETYAGHSWLCEHLVTEYTPAWHQPLGENAYDASIATVGLSRWHNYYLEGLGWLVKDVGIGGLYLDGVGYDREIMKRERKVLDRARSGCLIDFHSGNNYDLRYGLGSPANQYMELFPCINSLWLGEGYDYDETPDYWLVEVSGIPFGLYSEMLHGGGNPWRGMIYGMTNRLGWWGDSPAPIWNLWDGFGIQDAEMIGYWDSSCPVRTDNEDVLATVYLKKGKALVSIASWAKEPVEVKLSVDLERIGLLPGAVSIEAPAIERFQPGKKFSLTDTVHVEPGKGWLLILDGEK